MIYSPFSAEEYLRCRIAQGRTGRGIVGAVNLAVAVPAAPALGVIYATLTSRSAGDHATLAAQHKNVPPVWRMALVAQERWSQFQHVFHDGAVGVVASRAVFIDRLVTMHERSAFLHVALVAGFDHAIAFQEFRPDRTVRVMAVGASNLAFEDRMARRPVDLNPFVFVAGEADLRLGELVADSVPRVHRVTTGASGAAQLVRAAIPM